MTLIGTRLNDSGDRDLVGLCVGIVVSLTAMGIAGPIVPLLLVDLGAAPALLGSIIGGSTIVSLFLAVPGGYLTQRIGTRSTIVLGSLVMSFPCLIIAAAPSIVTVFFSLIVIESGRILVIVGAQAHVASLGRGAGAKPRNAGLDFGWYGSAAAVGQMLGPVIGGILLDRFGAESAFTVQAMIGLLSAGAYLLLVNNNRQSRAAPDRAGSGALLRPRFAWLRLLNRGAVTAIVASFAVIFALGARTSFYPIFVRDIGFSASAIGALMASRAFVSMSTRIFLGRLVGLAGGISRTLVGSMVVLAAGVGMTPLMRSLPLLFINSVFVGIGVGIALPLSMAVVSDQVDPDMRGVAMGVRLTGNRLATLVNPLLFGSIAQSLGISAAFVAGGVLLSVATLWVARATRTIVTHDRSASSPDRVDRG